MDPALARRLINNSQLRTAQGWGEMRDLRGALCVTSDAPISGLNCLRDFDTREADLEALLDIGFALLRAFDRDPAVELCPLDRPKSLALHLQRRGLAPAERRSWMVHRSGAPVFLPNPDLEVRIVEPEDAREFARVHGGSTAWVRRLSLQSTLEAMHHAGNTFYLGCLDGETVATLHLLIDGSTAGIYAVGTQRAYRRKGIASTLMARAITDACAAGAEIVGLSTDAGGDAERLYERLGFEPLFTSELWTRAAHRA
jgi:ribosomal protein S18 acetylase RimI-like enzyme